MNKGFEYHEHPPQGSRHVLFEKEAWEQLRQGVSPSEIPSNSGAIGGWGGLPVFIGECPCGRTLGEPVDEQPPVIRYSLGVKVWRWRIKRRRQRLLRLWRRSFPKGNVILDPGLDWMKIPSGVTVGSEGFTTDG